MREAIGGTILLYIVLIFLFVYIAFMAIVINYGRVFRSKNAVVSYIEQYEGMTDKTKEVIDKQVVAKQGYNGPVCICYNIAPNKNKYYTVKLIVEFSMPLVRKELYPKLAITGQTSGIPNLKSGSKDIASIPECSSGYFAVSGSGRCDV